MGQKLINPHSNKPPTRVEAPLLTFKKKVWGFFSRFYSMRSGGSIRGFTVCKKTHIAYVLECTFNVYLEITRACG